MWFFECCTAGDMDGQLVDSFEEIQEPFSLQVADSVSQPLANTLSQLWRPLTTSGTMQRRGMSKKTLFKETSFHSVDVNDLLATITRTRSSVFTEPGVFSISSQLLNQSLLEHLASSIDVSIMYPRQIVELRKKLLLIYTPDNKKQHRPYTSERCDQRVGTVEVILNSAFTGGEVKVHHNEEGTEFSVKPYDWVAMHIDAASSVSPVTSGARVSLLYDIIAVTAMQKPLLFVTGDFDSHQWEKKIFDGLRISSESSVPYLIQVAQKLRPDLVGKRHLIMDAQALNPVSLAGIAQQIQRSGKLERLFPDRELDIRPTHFAIHRKEHCGESYPNMVSNVRGKGYLGTLVMLVDSMSCGGYIHFSRGDEKIVFNKQFHVWYAYAAGTAHKMKRIIDGTRLSLHYDIYDAGSTITIHNPFRGYATGNTTDLTSVLTRPTASVSLRDQVLAAVRAELAKVECVVITLQFLYPSENIQSDALIGGDRALYDTLTSTSGVHRDVPLNIHLVNATLLYQPDPESNELNLERCTYCSCAGKYPEVTSNTENTKFIVPIKLTSKHRAEGNADILGPYFVTGLCVRKK